MSSKVFTYPGKNADVAWDGRLCIHVQECGRADNELFVGQRKPWCQPDLVTIDQVADVVERCPTGALSYRRKDGGPEEKPPAANTVTVANNGPLYLHGDLEIEGAGDDQPGLRTRAALCRCGESKNKPFCDNSHEKARFVDRGAIGERGPGASSESGSLRVSPAANGPLIVNGPMTLLTGAGRVAWRGDKAALCRCGASDNKPFCDGSHKKVGFESP